MSFLQHNTWSGLYMDSYCPLSNPFLTWFASVPYYHEAKFLGKSSTFLVLVQLHVIVLVHMFYYLFFLNTMLDIDALSK